jgi:hypothetical protein
MRRDKHRVLALPHDLFDGPLPHDGLEFGRELGVGSRCVCVTKMGKSTFTILFSFPISLPVMKPCTLVTPPSSHIAHHPISHCLRRR